MSEKLSCHIVEDLLPLYAEGLTGAQTAEDVKAHLDSCEACSKVYAAMTGAEEAAKHEQKAQDDAQIDYLKKVRKRSRKAAIIAVCVAAVVIAALFVVRIYVIGDQSARMVSTSGSVEGKNVTLHIISPYSTLAVSKVGFSEEDGVVTASIRTVPELFYHNNGVKTVTYTARQDVKTLKLNNGTLLWTDDVAIEPYTSQLFADKTKYIGDNSAVAKLVRTVFTSSKANPFGGFSTMELQTKTEPYGLKLVWKEETASASDDYLRELPKIMNNCACLLLACVDNLGYVEFEHESFNGQPYSYRFTLEDANALIGDALKTYGVSDIKGFSQSAGKLQQLTNYLGVN